MLDVSYRSDKPDSVLIYADGSDARVLRKLIFSLGSEEKAQTALILTGFLSKLEQKGGIASAVRARKVKENFKELVGISFPEFLMMTETF
ncbi:MAG TPA: hypothetical protein VN739_00255 [Nitrososphaerales archaeon]|nr:hypothetical protein [Nitrososphaerales archaeon]